VAQMVFRVTGLAIVKNARGVEMRRLTLRAVEGDAFNSPESLALPSDPEGSIDVVVTPEYVREKSLSLGDTTTVDIREQ
jgi:hypothetical protein